MFALFRCCFLAFFGCASVLLHAQLDVVKSYVQQVAKTSAYPGFSVVLVKDGALVWAEGFGQISAGEPAPVTADTPLAIGSMTKSFTALLVLQMVEEGLLDLDEPIVTYVPWFQTAMKTQSDKITLRMLLSNSAGIPSLDLGIQRDETDAGAIERLVRQFDAYVLNRKPGSSFEYSNEGFAIAGFVASTVAGKPYAALLQERILAPLQMKASTTDILEVRQRQLAKGHYYGIDAGIPAQTILNSTAYLAAGSLLHCSVRDMGRYLIAMTQAGRFQGRAIVQPETFAQLWQPHIRMPEDPEAEGIATYGFGWMNSIIDGRSVAHHGGATSTMTSYMMVEPERRAAVAVLSNIRGLDGRKNTGLATLANNMLHLYHGEPKSTFGEPKEADVTLNDFQLPPEAYANYLGQYQAPGLANSTVFIEPHPAGGLQLRQMSGQECQGMSRLDFMNVSRVVLRSIGGSQFGQFQTTLQGQVYGLNLGGQQRFKISQTAKQASIAIENARHAFQLPSGWEAAETERGFLAQATSEKLTLETFFSSQAAETIIAERWPQDRDIYPGAVHREALPPHTWRQQSFIVGSSEQARGYLLLSTSLGTDSFFLLFSAPADELSLQIQKTVFPVLKSMSLRSL